jgi:AcrR family transcriptional regulator
MLTSFTSGDVSIVNMARPGKIPDVESAKRDSYHHGDLKRALTEAALQLVQEKGPKGFTLREVARRAGVSTAAPYRHFADKSQLLAAAAAQGFVELHRALDATASAATDLTGRVLAMGRAYVRWAISHPDYYQIMFGSELDKRQTPELPAAAARAFDDLLGIIVECQQAKVLPSGDPREIAGPTWSLLHGVATLTIGSDLSHVGIDENPEELIERSLNALLFNGKP